MTVVKGRQSVQLPYQRAGSRSDQHVGDLRLLDRTTLVLLHDEMIDISFTQHRRLVAIELYVLLARWPTNGTSPRRRTRLSHAVCLHRR